ncbi:ubiquinone biosynthesis accessory factor UbiJ [Beggiatoa leptomitoformis]|uniref:Ubiquinone biosynthesis accessory factor UbiJ n=1 Tax=Beggiatoa leptomitoformis TaxID=288004 RepID=A0A2N9YGU6_9GAMM|nr:SCP2 sterol-binding domain-containing protein [Beggiatoa leptomitoformis]AUI69748.1 hypothetical protein BLE401_14320 [Beggiatoa leptomitoformis]QGX03685.1 hypothetical protein AL038_18965 [Beggiatoa leptomitoformis]
MIAHTLIASSAETLLNQALRLAVDDFSSLDKIDNKIIALDIQGINLQLYIFPSITNGFTVLSEYQGVADATICGLPFSLLRLLRQPAGTVSHDPDIVLSGDMDVIQGLMQVFRQLHIDWEEKLAHWVGDIPAHQLGRMAQQTQDYANDRWQTGQTNLGEYLQEELKVLPAGAEMQVFLTHVDTLRDDVARLEQRIALLTANTSSLP